MSIKDKLFKFLNEDEYEDEDEDDYIDESELVHTSRVNKGNEDSEEVAKRTSGLEEALRGKNAKVLVMEPKAYSESQEIAEHLLQKRAVIVNLQRIAPEQGKRIIDFLSGTIYAIDGELQKVSTNTFLCTPNTFGVAGRITEDENKKVQ
ncbi:cell division protein SepF [Erysipelotrichaceae bacterium]|nr:cell division protein SepF [Erysipelotrichaceae bacterium]